MKLKIFVVAIFAAAAALVVIALALDLGRNGDPVGSLATKEQNGPSQTIAAPAEVASTGAPEQPSEAGTQAAPTGATPSEPEPTRPSWDPQPSTSDDALEVPEQTAPAKARMPDSDKRKPVLEKAPKSQTSEGKLTDGFPKNAVPLPESSTVVRSSVDSQGDRVFVGVEGRVDAEIEEVLSFYREQFSNREWLISESSPIEGVTQLRGAFMDDSTTVTVRQLPTGTTAITVAGAYKVQG